MRVSDAVRAVLGALVLTTSTVAYTATQNVMPQIQVIQKSRRSDTGKAAALIALSEDVFDRKNEGPFAQRRARQVIEAIPTMPLSKAQKAGLLTQAVQETDLYDGDALRAYRRVYPHARPTITVESEGEETSTAFLPMAALPDTLPVSTVARKSFKTE